MFMVWRIVLETERLRDLRRHPVSTKDWVNDPINTACK
jgi:hypothetical protein